MSSINALSTTCLCGTVTIDIIPKSTEISACHCATCLKWSGGPNLVLESEQVSESGDTIGRYASSEWAQRAFCQQCGTHLYYKLNNSSMHYVPVGLFKENDDMKLSHQVFIDSKPHYYNFAEQTHCMTGEEVFAQFSGEQ